MSLAKKASELPAYEKGCDYFSTCPAYGSIYNYASDAQLLEDSIVQFAASVGITVRVTSRLRSCCEQSRLFDAGQTTARPTTSQHEFGFAFDLVPVSGYHQYNATFADVVAWLIALARFYGYDGLVEASHAHLQVFTNAKWKDAIAARDVVLSIPIPGKRPKKGT